MKYRSPNLLSVLCGFCSSPAPPAAAVLRIGRWQHNEKQGKTAQQKALPLLHPQQSSGSIATSSDLSMWYFYAIAAGRGSTGEVWWAAPDSVMLGPTALATGESWRKRELCLFGQCQCLVISTSFWLVMVSDSNMNLQDSHMVLSSMACCFSPACVVIYLSSACARYHILHTYGWTHGLKQSISYCYST